MKKIFAIAALALPMLVSNLSAQEGFDFKTLDKIGANATNRNVITLDGDMLKMAAGFLGGDRSTDSLRPLVESLKGVYIRSYEFDKEGQYNEADLEPLRNYLKQQQWNRVVESREGKELSEIYLLPKANGRLGGVAIISTEAKEVTVVYINGELKPEDIQKLGGNLGIPDIRRDLLKKTDKSKKDDEDDNE
jgi:hypothetical protein